MDPFTITIHPEKVTFLKLYFSTGNAPVYEPLQGTEKILERIEAISTIYTEKGYNLNSAIIEEYALCLVADKRQKEARRLFMLITGDSERVVAKKNDEFVMCANTVGTLGIEGAFQYALLSLQFENHHKAKALFKELADNGPYKMGIRGGDIWVESATQVLELQAYSSSERKKYEAIYKEAKAQQY